MLSLNPSVKPSVAAQSSPSARRGRLRTKILGWSFGPTAIILGAVALVTFYAYQRVAEDLVIARDREVTRLSASQLAVEFEHYLSMLTSITRSPDVFAGDAALRREALQRASSSLVIFDGGVVLLDGYGIVAATEPPRPEILGADWSDRAYYRQMLRTPGPAYSDTLFDGARGAPVVAMAVPVIGPRGELSGVLAGMFRLGTTGVSSFYGGIVKLRIGQNLYLVDSRGRVLYHRDEQRIGQDLSDWPLLQSLVQGKSEILRGTDERGRATVASYAPVPNTPWGLIIEERWEQLFTSTTLYRQSLLLLLVVGLVIPAIVVIVGVRRVTQPIADLIVAAQQVANGRFGQSITAHTGDEIEDLAEQFNAMSAQLRASYAELERRVADRTRELGALNAIAGVVSQSLDLNEILSSALAKTMQVMDMEMGAAWVLDLSSPAVIRSGASDATPALGDGAALSRPQSGVLTLVVHQGMPASTLGALQRIPLAEGSPVADQAPLSGSVAAEAARIGRAIVRHVEEYPTGPWHELLTQAGLRWVVGVPLIAKGRTLGALALASQKARDLEPEALALLAAIGQQIGVAADNARLYEQAEESATAAERSRLARDLHDAVTQTLFSASLIADVLPKLWERDPNVGRAKLDELRQLTRGALAEMRMLLLELRPSALLEAKLPDLLRQLCEAFTGRNRIPVQLRVSGECTMPQAAQVAMYRIAQEALNNITKHAAASAVTIDLECQDAGPESLGRGLRLTIADNGRGFDAGAVPLDHLGLGIMQERAQAIGAELSVRSEPGTGTTVQVAWGASQGHDDSQVPM